MGARVGVGEAPSSAQVIRSQGRGFGGEGGVEVGDRVQA